MPTSQLKVYSSGDASAPALSGSAGSLLTLLDAVLVNGYGSKTAAGWTKPIANSGNIGCYKQGAGAGFTLFVNDNGPNVTSTFKEAWCTGWETLATIAAPVGTGGGQFPLPAQLLTTGHVVMRKSTSVDSVVRDWTCFADAYTFYLFVNNASATPSACTALFFGDIYSLRGTSDIGRCMIVGNDQENNVSSNWNLASNGYTGMVSGHYLARTWGGGGVSIQFGQYGDIGWTSSAAVIGTTLNGLLPCPNGPDNSVYLCPLRINEANGNVRGRMRGVYCLAHPYTTFSDGQTFFGTGDYAGKTFQITPVASNVSARIAIEISNTVETN